MIQITQPIVPDDLLDHPDLEGPLARWMQACETAEATSAAVDAARQAWAAGDETARSRHNKASRQLANATEELEALRFAVVGVVKRLEAERSRTAETARRDAAAARATEQSRWTERSKAVAEQGRYALRKLDEALDEIERSAAEVDDARRQYGGAIPRPDRPSDISAWYLQLRQSVRELRRLLGA